MNTEVVALYARVSSDKQAEHGTIESQLGTLRAFCEEQGDTVPEELTYIDNGVSGGTLNRPALDKLRDRALSGTIDKVVVLCPDRLARKQVHQLILIEEFKRLGVEIVFTNRAISNTPEDQLLLQVQGVVAEYEREKILERSRRGKIHNARSGKVRVFAAAPYGYRRVLDGQDAQHEIVFDEAQVVRRIINLCVKERLSTKKIAEALTRQEVPTKKQRSTWDPTTVYAILTNPAYTGKAAYGRRKSVTRARVTKKGRSGYPKHAKSSCAWRPREEWITVPVPRIIDDALFEQAREQLEKNRIQAPRNTKHAYLLKGLMFCKECGHMLGGRSWSTKPKRHHRYKCLGSDLHREGNAACTCPAVRGDDIEAAVWEQVKLLLQQPELVFDEYSKRLETRTGASFEKLLAHTTKELRRHETQKERLIELYQTGTVSLDDVKKQIAAVTAAIRKTEQERNALLRQQEVKQKGLRLVERFDNFTKRLSSNLDALSFEQKRSVLELLVQEIVVDPRNRSFTIRHCIPVHESCQLHLQRPEPVVQVPNPLREDTAVDPQLRSHGKARRVVGRGVDPCAGAEPFRHLTQGVGRSAGQTDHLVYRATLAQWCNHG